MQQFSRMAWRVMLLILCLTWQVMSLRFLRGASGTSSQSLEPNLLESYSQDQSLIYSRALELLESVKSSPSCYRIATLALLESCQSIEGIDSELTLDNIRSTYAAQLAVCEIVEANSNVPHACEFITSPKGENSETSKAELTTCLQALGSQPQWWTSYSNSRQNAMVICQATRVEIEKDELLKTYKSFIGAQANADSALRQTVKFSADELKRHGDAYNSLKSVNEHLIRDITKASGRAKLLVESVASKLDAAIQTVLSTLTRTKTNIEGVENSIHNARVRSQDLDEHISIVFQNALKQSSELASVQTRHFNDGRVMLSELQGSLRQIRYVEAQDLLTVMAELHRQLQITNNFIISMSVKQTDVTSQLLRLNQSVEGLHASTKSLNRAQEYQKSLRAQIHQDMEVNFASTLTRLAGIEGSANSLGDVIRDVSESMTGLAFLTRVLDRLWEAVSLVVALLMIFVLSRSSALFIRAFIIATSLVFVIKMWRPAFLFFTEMDHLISSPLHIVLLGASSCVVLPLIFLYHRGRKLSGKSTTGLDYSDISFLRCSHHKHSV